jgi:hypothetical protein
MLHRQQPLLRFGNVCNAADTLVKGADIVIHLAAETLLAHSIFDNLLTCWKLREGGGQSGTHRQAGDPNIEFGGLWERI